MDKKQKQLKKGERTKKMILMRAGTLFAQKGYHAVSIDEIIDGLGIAKGTMYQYFDGKLGLLKDLLKFCRTEIDSVFESISVKDNDCRSVIREAYFKLNRLYFDTFDMINLNMSSGNIIIDENYKQIAFHLMDHFVKLLSPFKEEFRIRQDEMPFVVFLQGEHIRGYLRYNFGQSGAEDKDIHESIDFALDILQNGIFSNKIE
ncbi:MAG TPA: TetR/AcrR family transcriptional regulator [Spirochaetota bacterium]|nr:TetR/AcrR family transcriptional regulator [Spirochaetota bacterium]